MKTGKKSIILLHGAIGSKAQLTPLQKLLEVKYDVHNIDLQGHGENTEDPVIFSIEKFAMQVSDYINENRLVSVSIFGYSMGGYVALYLQKKYPGLIERIITLATKFMWDEATAANEVNMLNPDIIIEKFPAFAQELEKRHVSGWKRNLEKTKGMLISMGYANPLQVPDLNNINIPCRLMVGDRDKMVSIAETIAVSKQIPACELAVLPGTPHAIEKVSAQLLAAHINDFFE